MWSLQTPIPCNGWSLLGYPHLRLQVPLAHTLLQCKIHCEEIKKNKKKTDGKPVVKELYAGYPMPCTYQESEVYMMNGAQPLNKEKRYPPRFKWHRQRKPDAPLQSFALKLRSHFCKCCFPLTTAMEFTLCPTAATLLWHFLEAWLFSKDTEAPLPNRPLWAAVFPSLCHYPLARAAQF